MKFPFLKWVCWANTLFFIMVFCLFVMTLLSACGTKGDLYLPDSPSKSTVKNITKS